MAVTGVLWFNSRLAQAISSPHLDSLAVAVQHPGQSLRRLVPGALYAHERGGAAGAVRAGIASGAQGALQPHELDLHQEGGAQEACMLAKIGLRRHPARRSKFARDHVLHAKPRRAAQEWWRTPSCALSSRLSSLMEPSRTRMTAVLDCKQKQADESGRYPNFIIRVT